MAWRAYVDPTNSQWYITDDAGNFLPYGSDGAAAQAAATQRNGGALPSPNIASSPTGGSDWSSLWSALTGSNQQQFDWQKQQFGQSLTEQQREFNATNQLGQGSLWSSLLQNLLGNATQLANQPANWLNYANYTSGAKNIFDLLSGSKPVPAFQAPSASTPNNSLQQVLEQLGLISPQSSGIPSTGGTPSTGAGGGSLWQLPSGYNALQLQNNIDTYANQLNQSAGRWPSNQEYLAKIQSLFPNAPASFTQQVLDSMLQNNSQFGTIFPNGVNPQLGVDPNLPKPTDWIQQFYNTWAMSQPGQTTAPSQPSTTPDASIQAPLPYQINPLVWDSMSDTAKQVILASVQQGNTPSGYWSPTDYLSELNASRPLGVAPRRTSYNYQQPSSYF